MAATTSHQVTVSDLDRLKDLAEKMSDADFNWALSAALKSSDRDEVREQRAVARDAFYAEWARLRYLLP